MADLAWNRCGGAGGFCVQHGLAVADWWREGHHRVRGWSEIQTGTNGTDVTMDALPSLGREDGIAQKQNQSTKKISTSTQLLDALEVNLPSVASTGNSPRSVNHASLLRCRLPFSRQLRRWIWLEWFSQGQGRQATLMGALGMSGVKEDRFEKITIREEAHDHPEGSISLSWQRTSTPPSVADEHQSRWWWVADADPFAREAAMVAKRSSSATSSAVSGCSSHSSSKPSSDATGPQLCLGGDEV